MALGFIPASYTMFDSFSNKAGLNVPGYLFHYLQIRA